MKKVAVQMLDSGKVVERTVAPGTTAADLLRDIGIPNGLLSKSRDGDFLPNAQELYTQIEDGGKLIASSPAQVGASLLETIVNKALGVLDVKGTIRPTTNLSKVGGALSRPTAPLVERQQIPYWRQRGWKRNGWKYVGAYVTPYGAYTGWISQPSFREIEFYIQNPPDWVFGSSHAACFRPRGKEWFLVHMSRRPQGVSSGILTIERLITECFRARR